MNRRDFLRGLGGILAAAAAPQVLLGQKFKWKATRTKSGLWVINEEWLNAPYEIAMLVNHKIHAAVTITPVTFRRADMPTPPELASRTGLPVIHDPFPIRMNSKGQIVNPWKELS